MYAIKLVIIFFLPIKLLCQMTLLYPTIPTDHIHEMHFINENEVIFINDGGSIYKSYDGGATWELKKFFPDHILHEMHFIDGQTGFIKSSNQNLGLIYTTDAGEHWDTHTISINSVNPFMPLSESKIIKSNYDGDIFLLDNFFNDWQLSYQFPTFLDTTSCCGVIKYSYGHITQFEKLPSGSILALGDNSNAFDHDIIDDSLALILNSNDLGSSWDTLWGGFSDVVYNLSFSNDSVGWMNTSSSIFKTTNGGNSWTNQNVEGIDYLINDIYALPENELYAVTYIYNPQFIKSVNSGEDWKISDLDIENGYYKINFFDEDAGFLYGNNLLKTEDAGQSWFQCDSSIETDIYDIDFRSLKEGLALGKDGLFITHDGGYSWSKQFDPEGIYEGAPSNIEMLSDFKGWLVTNEKIYKTDDGGFTWENIILSENRQLYRGVEFFDENLGIIYSVGEEISPHHFEAKYHYITTNGGGTWDPILIKQDSVSNYPGYYDKVQFIDSTHLWAINQQGLWFSSDTAKTW